MKNKLNRYIGRNVRLEDSTFRRVSDSTDKRYHLENIFVVATVTHGTNKLICYGANRRIAVSLSEVVMV